MSSARNTGRELARADLILLSLPVLFIAVYAVAMLFVQAQAVAVGMAALACCPLIGDGLFVNPPTDR